MRHFGNADVHDPMAVHVGPHLILLIEPATPTERANLGVLTARQAFAAVESAAHVVDPGEALRAAGRRLTADVADFAAGAAWASELASVTALLSNESTAALAQIGDSRAYLFRDGTIRVVERDGIRDMSTRDNWAPTGTRPGEHTTITLLAAQAGDRFLIGDNRIAGHLHHQPVQEAIHHAPLHAAADLLHNRISADHPGPCGNFVLAEHIDATHRRPAPSVRSSRKSTR